MAISIIESKKYSDGTHRTYYVTIDGFGVDTVFTFDSAVASDWITVTSIANEYFRRNIIVGFHVDWHPDLPDSVATLRLLVANRCLIYRMLRRDVRGSDELIGFLGSAGSWFCGVGVEEAAAKLAREFGLEVRNRVELRDLAAAVTGDEGLRSAGIKTLAERSLGMAMEEPSSAGRSDPDPDSVGGPGLKEPNSAGRSDPGPNWWLGLDEVKYAVADALVSWKLGLVLGRASNEFNFLFKS